MGIVVPPRLASASVVFFGPHGQISRQAQQRSVSRQRWYREVHSVLRALDQTPARQPLACLQLELGELQGRLQPLQVEQRRAVVCTADLQAEFVSTAQAEGVRLSVARLLLAVFLRENIPSVAYLGRQSRQAGLHAGALLEVFDEHARPRVRPRAADEIFFGPKPVLLVVEPESLCGLAGRLSARRDGEAWVKEFERLPELEHRARDGGKGLANGLARVNEGRRQQKREPIGDPLDPFPTLREAGRGLRQTQGQAEQAWTAAEEADKQVARQDRRGLALSGYATQTALQWQKAEAAFHAWERVEQILQQIRQTLRPFTAAGELNRREQVLESVAAFTSQWRQPETSTYLDRLKGEIESLPVAAEVRKAVVHREGIRQNPALVQGEGQRQAVLRGVLLIGSVVIAQAGEAGRQAVAALRQLLQLTPEQLRSHLSALPGNA